MTQGPYAFGGDGLDGQPGFTSAYFFTDDAGNVTLLGVDNLLGNSGAFYAQLNPNDGTDPVRVQADQLFKIERNVDGRGLTFTPATGTNFGTDAGSS